MSPQPNPSLSVDCVVFGFDGAALKVLLVELEKSMKEGKTDTVTVTAA